MTVTELVGMQYVPCAHMRALGEIYNNRNDACLIATDAFLYGVIQGKREERARRKRKNR